MRIAFKKMDVLRLVFLLKVILVMDDYSIFLPNSLVFLEFSSCDQKLCDCCFRFNDSGKVFIDHPVCSMYRSAVVSQGKQGVMAMCVMVGYVEM